MRVVYCRFMPTILVVAGILVSTAWADVIPFDSERWMISAEDHRIEEHLGRRSLYLRNGQAWIDDDAGFLNGQIEFDIAFTGERGFMGGMWRVQDENNYEEFYVRPHQSGKPDANQYTPAFHGLTAWQLYHGEGYGAPVEYPIDEWISVRIVASGSRGEVFINSEEPVLVIRELKRALAPGKVGVNAFFAPAHFSNFRYRKIDRPDLGGKAPAAEQAPAGAVMSWRVSNPFSESSLERVTVLSEKQKVGLTFTSLPAEESGITNLARLAGPGEEKNTVFAVMTLDSAREQVKGLRFGYSDRVRVFLNDRLIYSGNNGYRSRDYRFLGTIGLFDVAYLPLEKGRNEVWLAVSEAFGGWGVLAALEDLEGVSIVGVEKGS